MLEESCPWWLEFVRECFGSVATAEDFALLFAKSFPDHRVENP